MKLNIYPENSAANAACAEALAHHLTKGGAKTIMVAAGNTPLELYRLVGLKKLDLSHLTVFALDEYVGVPLDEPRNCANLLREHVANAWNIPPERFHAVSSLETEAFESVRQHERRIAEAGGLDAIVLGLGQNGHLGFNEPGSQADAPARVLDLASISIEANRKWFHGKYAPAKGVTVGMTTILSARKAFLLAYGSHKTTAVTAMCEQPLGPHCPASFLQNHPDAAIYLDAPAAAGLRRQGATA